MQIPLELRSEMELGTAGKRAVHGKQAKGTGIQFRSFPLESDWNVPVRDREELEPGKRPL